MSKDKIIAHIDKDLEELITMFFEESQNELKELSSAVEKKDFKTLKLLGHRIKGSSLSFGFKEMSDIGVAIEETAKQGKDIEKIKKLVNDLNHYIKNVEVVYQ